MHGTDSRPSFETPCCARLLRMRAFISSHVLRAYLIGPVELPELLLLRTIRVEILRRQPPFEGGLPGRPLGFQHGEPGSIAAAALDDHMVAENTLERKAEPQCRATRRRIEGIAFPLVAAIAERLEDISRQEILRL